MENLEKEFVPYPEALELKQLGFDEPCFGRFDGRGKNKGKIWYEIPNTGQDSIPVGDVLAPTYSQCFRWFRKKYGLHSEIRYVDDVLTYSYLITKIKTNTELEEKFRFTYEEAELACLRKLISIIKNK